jgi:hypothetical protein
MNIFSALSAQNLLSAYGDTPPTPTCSVNLRCVVAGFIPALLLLSSLRHRVSIIQHPASSIQHPASSIQYPASSIQHPASSIEYPVSFAGIEQIITHIFLNASPVFEVWKKG